MVVRTTKSDLSLESEGDVILTFDLSVRKFLDPVYTLEQMWLVVRTVLGLLHPRPLGVAIIKGFQIVYHTFYKKCNLKPIREKHIGKMVRAFLFGTGMNETRVKKELATWKQGRPAVSLSSTQESHNVTNGDSSNDQPITEPADNAVQQEECNIGKVTQPTTNQRLPTRATTVYNFYGRVTFNGFPPNTETEFNFFGEVHFGRTPSATSPPIAPGPSNTTAPVTPRPSTTASPSLNFLGQVQWSNDPQPGVCLTQQRGQENNFRLCAKSTRI